MYSRDAKAETQKKKTKERRKRVTEQKDERRGQGGKFLRDLGSGLNFN